ncbi:ATP-dependent DNA helicase PcrA [Anoxybacter fermentans]|uniref:ATP-dependent DNA helicase n=1 Tax=Anoxybacter fermentans TaxID=1323375 RepID=A0A3Q9HNH6_9FIRM|nr:DNA helicase PcrA [Anoxybacter fermentans]AZR72061.1 ATP-dependent DNA helicase PcrA [Anoxybacter fermentans]
MKILQDLNDKQREAVEHLTGPLLILAGAGSGKTRVLTHRIAYMIYKGISPYNILAVTFTNKAANEMKERVKRLLGYEGEGLWIGTFHSICVRILRKEIEKLGYKGNFVIYDTSDQLTVIKEVMKELNIDTKKFNPRAIQATISNAKNELIGPEEFANNVGDYFEEIVSKIYKPYQDFLKENNALDFDDLIMVTVELFKKYDLVKKYYQNKFKYILVDEYQDTNHAQYVFVNLLAQRHRNLCVVGDPDQSIYGFRGADIRNILSFEEDYPDAKVVKLEQNYRSTERILDAAHHVIVKNVNRKEKRLWTKKGQGEDLTLFEAVSDKEEAQYVVSEILKLRRKHGYNYSDFAILYRTNSQSRVFEDVLMKNRIPYKIVGGLKFYDRMEIKDVLAYLKLIYNPADDLAFMRIINKPRRGIGNTSLNRLAQFAAKSGISMYEAAGKVDQISNIRGKAKSGLKEFYQMMEILRSFRDDLKVTDLTRRVLDKSGYLKDLESEGTIEAQTRIENIQELFSVMEEFIRSGQGYTVGSFLEEVSLTTDLDEVDEAEDGVLLMTLHTVKGLEFPVVFMTGMEEMIFPHARALDSESELEEERRLCYVGITRARELLYMTLAKSRMVFGQIKYNPPSRFINDIPPELFGLTLEDEPAQEMKEPEELEAASSGKFAQYVGGEKVRHPKWGIGTVVGVRGQGKNQELDILFPKPHGLKKVLLEYAPIERV